MEQTFSYSSTKCYFLDVNYDYFSEYGLEEALKDQLNSVYPEIINEIKKVCIDDKEFCRT